MLFRKLFFDFRVFTAEQKCCNTASKTMMWLQLCGLMEVKRKQANNTAGNPHPFFSLQQVCFFILKNLGEKKEHQFYVCLCACVHV